ncbi:C40 family peptidase [Spongiimicrobium sp. 3-5]|uniref:C40 family peptidase n=1 Tax=Spongiimicrobium sp. 3-5 TaxID=3332596 RepID=UPI00397F90C7
MVRKILSFSLLFSLIGCGVVKKKTSYAKPRTVSVEGTTKSDSIPKESNPKEIPNTVLTKADGIINTAMTYSGVRYKFGGTTRKGMDCSGLLFVSFAEHNVALPRASYQMADDAKRIKLDKVTKGDLLFFKTSRKGKRINHVGLVVDVIGDDIKFIHSTSSRGVIVSSLREGFWNYAFVKAARVL